MYLVKTMKHREFEDALSSSLVKLRRLDMSRSVERRQLKLTKHLQILHWQDSLFQQPDLDVAGQPKIRSRQVLVIPPEIKNKIIGQ